MPSVSKSSFLGRDCPRRQNSFALQLVMPIALLMIAAAGSAIVAAYQTRISATRGTIQTAASQMQEDTARQVAAIIAQNLPAAMNTDTMTPITSALQNAYGVNAVGGNAISGDFAGTNNANATVNAQLNGGAADIPGDLILNLSQPYVSTNYPNIRLALVKPGTPFICKQYSYTLTTGYTQQDRLTTNGAASNVVNSQTTNQVVIYEIPGQFAIEGGTMTINNNVAGTVLGNDVTIGPGGSVNNNVVGDTNVNWTAGAAVGGYNLPSKGTAVGFEEALANQAFNGYTNQIGVAQDAGSCVLVPVGDRSLDQTETPPIPKIFETPPPVPTDWTVYYHPYYSANVRVTSTNADASANGNTTCVQTTQDAVHGGYGAKTATVGSSVNGFITFSYQPTVYSGFPAGQALVADVAVGSIPNVGGTQTLFIDLQTTAGGRNGVIVELEGGAVLNNPLSIVSANPVAIVSDFNTNNLYPVSILAPRILNSISGNPSLAPATTINGPRALSTRTSSVSNPLTTLGSYGASASAMNNFDITNLNQLPPITLKNWLIVSYPP